ncbi:rhomboid family intramembrane serine protease [Winogradskyella aurantiaca]|uniref:rhomboid family intramembrane serine protease n=1 Tax=Winogradskyella aurantiaca TaxID=2219558 RepID=UPI000E1E20B6|nr:rhomboid family intramembrane serine protease [Winogradskyella aurantiaca]
MYNVGLVTIIIIAANVLVSFKGFNDRLFFEKFKFNIGAIRRGEQVRMVSSGFLHADTTHLLFNMITLYFFADVVLQGLGNFNFILIYLGSLIVGNLLSFFFHKDEYWYSAIGASGAVTGILYAAILIRPEMSLYLFFIPIPIPGYIFGVAYLLYSIYGMKSRSGNIGHDAHFGGAVGGYFLTLVMKPQILETHLTYALLLAVPIVVLYFLHKTGKLS